MGVTCDISRSRRGSKEDILDSNTESGAKVTQGEAQGESSHIMKEEMEEQAGRSIAASVKGIL